MIAMALICEPKLLIADEPTTALDVTIQAQILDLMRDLRTRMDTAVILITHDLGVISEMADRVAVMYAARIVEIGNVKDIFASPKHPYTQGLLRSVPNIQLDAASLYKMEGMPPNLLHPPAGCRFHNRCPYVMDICREKPPHFETVNDDHYTECWLYDRSITSAEAQNG
jgi:oligopeptide transport system ATP-binding protein